jgi:hypothetical protein
MQKALAKAAKAYAGIDTYDSEVWMQERVGGKLRPEERVRKAFVKSPLKIYVRWLPGGANAGLQLSHNAERDGAKHFRVLAAGLKSLAGVRTFALENAVVRKLYPHRFLLNEYHLGFLLAYVDRVIAQAASRRKLTTVSDKKVNDGLPGRSLRVIEIDLADGAADGADFRRVRLGFDEATQLPLLIQTFTADGGLDLSYRFVKFTPNAALDDSTFELKK